MLEGWTAPPIAHGGRREEQDGTLRCLQGYREDAINFSRLSMTIVPYYEIFFKYLRHFVALMVLYLQEVRSTL